MFARGWGRWTRGDMALRDSCESLAERWVTSWVTSPERRKMWILEKRRGKTDFLGSGPWWLFLVRTIANYFMWKEMKLEVFFHGWSQCSPYYQPLSVLHKLDSKKKRHIFVVQNSKTVRLSVLRHIISEFIYSGIFLLSTHHHLISFEKKLILQQKNDTAAKICKSKRK